MSKSLDDILGTASTDVDENVATIVEADAVEDYATSLKQADLNTPACPDGATNNSSTDRDDIVVDGTETIANDNTDHKDLVIKPVAPEVEHVDVLETADEALAFRPYMLNLKKPTRMYRNKQMTKPDMYYTGVVKVLTQDNNAALVEFMVVANGVRRRARAYIKI